MPYRNAKVYNDGSHYIAIPQTNNLTKQKKSPTKTVCTGKELQTETNKTEKTATENLTPKERFEKIYRENNGKRKAEKIEILTKELKQDFQTEQEAEEFVRTNIERIKRNKIVRKTRLARKINLNEWNWFCTFTYSDEKHTEESFRKGLSEVLKRMVHRKCWRYIGVWERGGETNRLHFHGIFYIPKNGMPGELEEKKDYSFGSRKRQMIMQNTYFNDKFGRNDFNELNVRQKIANSARYLMKYIEKSGEKLIYSRNIPTYSRSDIMDEDVLCTIGQEDKTVACGRLQLLGRRVSDRESQSRSNTRDAEVQLIIVFLPVELKRKRFCVKGKVHCFATPDGKQKYTKQKAVNPFPFVPLPSKDNSKTKTIRRYNPSEISNHICPL